MWRKVCPCLAWLSGSQQRVAYNPRHELEEEEFMHQIEEEGKKYEQDNQLGLGDDVTPIEERLDYELRLNSTSAQQKQQQEAREWQQKKIETAESRYREALPDSQTDKPPLDLMGKPPLDLMDTPEEGKEEPDVPFGELVINLPPIDENYNLLKECTFNAEGLLDTASECTQIPINSLGGKNSKLNINKTKLRAWKRADSPYSFVLEYTIPCSYSFYTSMANRKVLPKDNNKFIKEFKLLESLHPNLTYKYLCLCKIGALEPREFSYLKYTNSSQTTDRGHWQVCISKDSQNESNVKAGRLHSISYILEKLNQGQSSVEVRTYVKLDIGVSIEKIWDRIFMETKAYIEGFWEEAAEEFQAEEEDLV